MRATIMMLFDEGEYEYGTYPYDTDDQKNKTNELAMNIRDERGCQTYVKEVE